jgi:hypothetical protein
MRYVSQCFAVTLVSPKAESSLFFIDQFEDVSIVALSCSRALLIFKGDTASRV